MQKQILRDLREVLKAYQVRCRGIDKERHPVLPKEDRELAIVSIYRDGKTDVKCRYNLGTECDANPDNWSVKCIYRK